MASGIISEECNIHIHGISISVLQLYIYVVFQVVHMRNIFPAHKNGYLQSVLPQWVYFYFCSIFVLAKPLAKLEFTKKACDNQKFSGMR